MQNNQLQTQGHIKLEDEANVPNRVPYLNWTFLSDMWLGVAPRTDTKKTYVQKKLDYMLK